MSGYCVLAIEGGKVTRADAPTLPEAQRTMRKKAPSSAIFVGKKCFAKSVGIGAPAFDELILAARAGGLGTCSFCDGDAVAADTDGDAFCRKHEMLRDGTGDGGAEEAAEGGDDEGDIGETGGVSVAEIEDEGEVPAEEPKPPRSATPPANESPRQAPRRVRSAPPPAAQPPDCVIPGCTNTPSPFTPRLDAALRALCLTHRRRAFTVRNESKTDAAGAVKILHERALREQATPGGTGCAWSGCGAPRSSKDTDDPTLANYCGRHRGLAKSHRRHPGQGNASKATPPTRRPTTTTTARGAAPQAAPVSPLAPRAVFEQLLADHELVEFVGRDVVEALAARVKRGAR